MSIRPRSASIASSIHSARSSTVRCSIDTHTMPSTGQHRSRLEQAGPAGRLRQHPVDHHQHVSQEFLGFVAAQGLMEPLVAVRPQAGVAGRVLSASAVRDSVQRSVQHLGEVLLDLCVVMPAPPGTASNRTIVGRPLCIAKVPPRSSRSICRVSAAASSTAYSALRHWFRVIVREGRRRDGGDIRLVGVRQ